MSAAAVYVAAETVRDDKIDALGKAIEIAHGDFALRYGRVAGALLIQAPHSPSPSSMDTRRRMQRMLWRVVVGDDPEFLEETLIDVQGLRKLVGRSRARIVRAFDTHDDEFWPPQDEIGEMW